MLMKPKKLTKLTKFSRITHLVFTKFPRFTKLTKFTRPTKFTKLTKVTKLTMKREEVPFRVMLELSHVQKTRKLDKRRREKLWDSVLTSLLIFFCSSYLGWFDGRRRIFTFVTKYDQVVGSEPHWFVPATFINVIKAFLSPEEDATLHFFIFFLQFVEEQKWTRVYISTALYEPPIPFLHTSW